MKSIIDKEDYEKIKYYTWYVSQNYVRCEDGVLGRIIMNETDTTINIGYKDSNPLNNSKKNLIRMNEYESYQHRKKQKGTTSKYMGVSFNTEKQKWRAVISTNGKSIFLGYFVNEEDAAKKRDKYIIENNLKHPLNEI